MKQYWTFDPEVGKWSVSREEPAAGTTHVEEIVPEGSFVLSGPNSTFIVSGDVELVRERVDCGCKWDGKSWVTRSSDGVMSRANRLADECGRLQSENTKLLAENAMLRREVENIERRVRVGRR